jgi:hypothetical protein
VITLAAALVATTAAIFSFGPRRHPVGHE